MNCAVCIPMVCTGLSLDPAKSLSFLSLTRFAPECREKTLLFSITYGPPSPVTTCVPYHLRDFFKMPQKSPNVFYHLQTLDPVTTSVSYHLQKTPGGGTLALSQEGGKHAKSFVALLLPALFPVSPLLHYSYKKMGVGDSPRHQADKSWS
jgi:hypothetical protein